MLADTLDCLPNLLRVVNFALRSRLRKGLNETMLAYWLY